MVKIRLQRAGKKKAPFYHIVVADSKSPRDGKIIEKKSKRGKVFYGCNNYPKCSFASWDKPISEKCPDCFGALVIKKDKVKCMNCDYEREYKEEDN